MSRTVWSIVIIGFLTVVFLVMAMFLVLQKYNESSYSSATKLAQGIKNEFNFESVGTATDVLPTSEGLRSVLLVQYDTHVDTKFDVTVQKQEMEKVARFAAEKSDAGDQKRFFEIRVRRTEIHGRGCFQQSYVSDHTLPNPFRAPPRQP
jgi:hypothetical protein